MHRSVSPPLALSRWAITVWPVLLLHGSERGLPAARIYSGRQSPAHTKEILPHKKSVHLIIDCMFLDSHLSNRHATLYRHPISRQYWYGVYVWAIDFYCGGLICRPGTFCRSSRMALSENVNRFLVWTETAKQMTLQFWTDGHRRFYTGMPLWGMPVIKTRLQLPICVIVSKWKGNRSVCFKCCCSKYGIKSSTVRIIVVIYLQDILAKIVTSVKYRWRWMSHHLLHESKWDNILFEVCVAAA
jgi:hypothetical protein